MREVALDQYGYVTTRDVATVGVPAVELRKLAARGALTNIAYGLYRLADSRPTEHDQFAEALLRVSERSTRRGIVDGVSDLAEAVLPLIRTRADLWRWSASDEHGRQMHDAVAMLEEAAET